MIFVRAFAIVATLCAVPGSSALAQHVPGYPDTIRGFDPREVAMLPKFCLYTQDFREHIPAGADPEQIAHWYEVMGPGFHAMHHYCYGLMKTNRGLLLARDDKIRHFYFTDANGEFDFVIRNVTDDFVMLPEILLRKGENLVRIGRGAQALELFARASQLKPDYWAPYAQTSDYYKETGDFEKARAALQTGLSFAPDAKGLRRRLTELDAEIAKSRKSPSKQVPKQQASSER